MVRAKLTQKRYYESGSEEESEDEVASRPPAKKKANQKVSQPRKIIYKDDVSESESAPEEEDDDSDFGAKKTPKKSPKKKAATPKKGKKAASKKKTPAKATPKKGKGSAKKPIKPTLSKKKAAKNGHSGGRSSGRQPIRKSYADDSDESEDESQSEEESEEESESEEEVYVKPKKGSKKSAKKPPKKIKKVKKPSHPPVGEMFVTAIKRLKDHPRKGSSMAAIKGFMAEEWGLIIPKYGEKIKRFVLQAVEDGEVIQTKGKGLRGRFTVKGLKPKKRKKNPLASKKLDEDEVDYVPKKTARDEAKAKTEEELEAQRQQRMEEAVRKELEKANKPKRPVAPKKTEWEVEMIKAMKVTEDETYYKVKWFGSKAMTWEPEENLRGCQDAIDNFLIEEKSRIREEEARKKKLEEDGEYEVSRIMDVQILDGGAREFLVRWKYCSPKDDTWEPEDNLAGNEEMIEKFMDKHDQTHGEHISEKALRVAPKKVEKLNYKDLQGAGRKKQGGWNGTRMTYYGMDSEASD